MLKFYNKKIYISKMENDIFETVAFISDKNVICEDRKDDHFETLTRLLNFKELVIQFNNLFPLSALIVEISQNWRRKETGYIHEPIGVYIVEKDLQTEKYFIVEEYKEIQNYSVNDILNCKSGEKVFEFLHQYNISISEK